ncbi:hypothetical protein FJT64_018484 [Amphibalanus amphitrite]|uniref:Uncharacterized protein n=1 Tax=Amphibalanus amphitrite TaxID=1232801 RepID=A0A6A4X6D5_AMPAM|nr:hypothetical protein FJT64_018484 [Amphibalanus amphitrite]
MSGPLRRRLELPMPNRSGLVVRSDPALPSPVTDLANNLSAASISSSDEADTPTTSAVLGGRSRSRSLSAGGHQRPARRAGRGAVSQGRVADPGACPHPLAP